MRENCMSGDNGGWYPVRGAFYPLVTIRIGYPEGHQVILVDQILTSPMGSPGDSGSLLVDRHRRAIGLLVGGSFRATVYNDITHVLDRLEITF
jgi:hypothetical protein